MERVDTPDLKSGSVWSAGSSPACLTRLLEKEVCKRD